MWGAPGGCQNPSSVRWTVDYPHGVHPGSATALATAAPVVPPTALVPRTSLLERLDEGSTARAVCLSAPGGYGKSTLLAQWVARQDRRVIWLTVPAGTDAVALAERLALELSRSSRRTAPLPTVPDNALWFSVVLPTLERLVAEQHEPFVLVLDDAMNLSDAAADTLLSALVSALPEGSQLVVATRTAAPQAFRRLRTTGRTLELGPSDLVFDRTEAHLLLDELGVHLPRDQRERVVQVTEGWPVGVYLLGRAILSDPDLVVDAAPSAWAPSWISDYIRDELFDSLEPEDAAFLMAAAVLDDLTGPTCDAVTGLTDSLARLRRLAQHNQLIGQVEGQPDTYRLHQMFADFLRHEQQAVSLDRYRACHRSAAEWFAESGHVELAVQHARQCADDRFLGQLIWQHAGLLLGTGQLSVVRRFIGGIPDDRLDADCGLALTAAWVSAHEADAERLTTHAAAVDRLLEGEEVSSRYRWDADILRSFLGKGGLSGMVACADRAIDGLPAHDPWLTVAFYLRASARFLLEDEEGASADIARCRALSESVPVPHLFAFALAAQAQLAMRAGELSQALDLARRASETLDTHQLRYMPAGAVIHTNCAGVLLAAGRRDEARAEADHALRLTALIGPSIPWFAVQGRLLLAQITAHLDDPSQARILLDEAEGLDHHAYQSGVLDQLREETATLVGSRVGSAGRASLTTAELRVLQYLPTHLSFPEIAETLYLSRHTVKTQAISIYRKLGVSSRGAAVDRARAQDLLPRT